MKTGQLILYQHEVKPHVRTHRKRKVGVFVGLVNHRPGYTGVQKALINFPDNRSLARIPLKEINEYSE